MRLCPVIRLATRRAVATTAFRMAPFRFWKLHGCGNDYVFVDAWAHHIPDPPAVARAISPRNTALGSDGLILVGPATEHSAHFRMRIFNADGSEAETCGNGLRCAAKFAYESCQLRRESMRVETLAGVVGLELAV